MTETRPALIGPIQFMTVLLHQPTFEGSIADEFFRLDSEGVITLIDIAIVARTAEDEFDLIDLDAEILPGRPLLGAVVGSLIGFGAAGEAGAEIGAEIGLDEGIELTDSEDVYEEWGDDIPVGGVAAVIAFEQTWARTLLGAIRDNGGEILGDDIIHAEDLIDAGIELGDALLAD